MPARRNPDEETVARRVDDRLRLAVVHELQTSSSARITRRATGEGVVRYPNIRVSFSTEKGPKYHLFVESAGALRGTVVA
jgi:hypothetical protein